MRAVLGLLAAWLCAAAAPDSEPVTADVETPRATIRAGNHRGFGRVTVETTAGISAQARREGGRVLVTIAGKDQGIAVAGTQPPRNVRAILGGAGRAEIAIAAEAKVRITRERFRLTIDVFDTTAATPVAESAAAMAANTRVTEPALPTPPIATPPIPTPPLTAPTTRIAPESAKTPAPDAALPHASLADARGAATAAGSTPDEPVPPPAGPTALAVRPLPADQGGGVLIPFEAGVGAAAFRHADLGVVVFDQRKPLDLAALRSHPLFGAANVQLLTSGVVFRLTLPPGIDLALTRLAQGWQVGTQVATTEPIDTRRVDEKLLYATSAASAVVSMTDPDTGGILLVGTVRRAGPSMPATRHWATWVTQRSWLGLVVEPLSDSLTLRAAGGDGFLLSGGPSGLPLGDDAREGARMAQAVVPGLRFGLPTQSPEGLLGLRRAQLMDAADAPPLGRGPKRRALAATLLTLGLAVEAQAILQIAASDDPREADAPPAIGLGAVAALLGGRIEEATGLDDPRLAEGEEPRFWRAVRAAMRTEGAVEAATDFAATTHLLLSYPNPLRDRVAPLAVETLLIAGQNSAATGLMERLGDVPGLAYARALQWQGEGQLGKALAALDFLAAGPDRLLRARAGARAVELRLAIADFTPQAAAAALEKLLLTWRGDARDLALRLRVAELHVQAGQWRPALALLRETNVQFPDEQALIGARLRQSVAQLLREAGMERMAPLDLVALVDENADLMPDGEAGAEIAARLSDRLMALDLPRRAIPLLRKLIAGTPAGAPRARFGARLAVLLLNEADPAGARAALDVSAADDLPPALAEERGVLAGRAQAKLGDPVAAVAALASFDSEASLRARAAILEESHNWPQATEVLRTLIARTVPADGKLDDSQQRGLLRLATAAAQAGDTPLLEQLRGTELPRLSPGPVADLFRLLTAETVQGLADLPRAGREIALARALSADPTRR